MNTTDAITPCWSCNKRPATTRYTNQTGKLSELVCEPCLDLLRLQEAFGRGVLACYEWDVNEQYDEILSWLDTFEKENRHRDIDNWLARNAMAHRALVYRDAERYEESLAACEQRELLGYDDVWDRYHVGSLKAGALKGLGRHAEALAVFEEAFRLHDPRHLPGARYYLNSLVEYSTNVGKPVDESWRELAQRIAEHYHVEFPDRPTLAESMSALYEMTKTDEERMASENDDEND